MNVAYVWGEGVGVCPEHPIKMGDALNGTPGLDIDAEVRLAERTVEELHADPSLSEKAVTRALKDRHSKVRHKVSIKSIFIYMSVNRVPCTSIVLFN